MSEAAETPIKVIYGLVGNCCLVKRILEPKPWKSKWAVIKLLDAILRGIGQIGFSNNPISGLIVAVAFLSIIPSVGLAIIMGATIANLVALVLHQPSLVISDGLASFNGSVVATATISIYGDYGYAAWVLAILGSVISVPLQIGLGNIFSSKLMLPICTIPYNIIQLAIAAILLRGQISAPNFSVSDLHSNASAVGNVSLYVNHIFSSEDDTVESSYIVDVYHGIVQGVGQMYVFPSIIGSYAIAAAIFFCSPILALSAIYGSALSTLLATVVEPESEISNIYNGLWGYNGALIATAISLFYRPTLLSFLLLNSAVLMTTAFKHFILVLVFQQAKLPLFSVPFVTLMPIFLAIGNTAGFEALRRTDGSSVPEAERRRYFMDGSVESAEEKIKCVTKKTGRSQPGPGCFRHDVSEKSWARNIYLGFSRVEIPGKSREGFECIRENEPDRCHSEFQASRANQPGTSREEQKSRLEGLECSRV